jgi:hypothetical protein
MADASTSPLSQADVLALISSTSATSFVGSGVAMPVAALMTNYPPSAAYQGLYARVSDLYGSVDDIMRCRFDGSNYRWVPQREAFIGINASSGGTVTITPLVTPPTLRLTTTALTSNLNVTASTVNAYIGQRHRVIMPPALSLGVYVSQITGLIGSNISLLAGNVKDIEYGATGWFQSS